MLRQFFPSYAVLFLLSVSTAAAFDLRYPPAGGDPPIPNPYTADIVLDTRINVIAVDSPANNPFRISGVIEGDEGRFLEKRGTGELILSGSNFYAGDTLLREGTLGIANSYALGDGVLVMSNGTVLKFVSTNLSLANAVSFDGNSVVNTLGFSAELTGGLYGSGNWEKIGGGVLTLTPSSGRNNAVEGTLTITDGEIIAGNSRAFTSVNKIALEGGILNLNNNNAVIGELSGDDADSEIILGSATLRVNQGSDTEYAGQITGTGRIQKSGTGKLTLSGDNTFSGGTDVIAGTLEIANINSLGAGAAAIASSAILELSGDGVYSNTFTGTGTLLFSANGRIDSNFDGVVNVTGRLGSNNRFGLLYVERNGTFSPDGIRTEGLATYTAIGSVNVGAAIFETGSELKVNVDAVNKTNSQVIVAEGGRVLIQPGANLSVQLLNNRQPAENQRFRVIDTVKESFTDTTLFNTNILYTAVMGDNFSGKFFSSIENDGYWITYYSDTPYFENNAIGHASDNTLEVAGGLDRIFDSGHIAPLQRIFDALGSIPKNRPIDRAIALSQLHGEVYLASRDAVMQLQKGFLGNLPKVRDWEYRYPSNYRRCSNLSLWTTFVGDFRDRRVGIKGFYDDYTLNTAGIVVGGDKHLSRNFIGGFALGYDYSSLGFDTLRSRSSINSIRTMLYGGYAAGDYYCDSWAGYSKNWHQAHRSIDIGTTPEARFTARTTGKYNDDVISVGFEAGRTFDCQWVDFVPYIGLDYTFVHSSGLTEKGGGQANLRIGRSNLNSLRMPIGVRFKKEFNGLFCD
ncbi:MAG: autotransporter domain-containing protein [Planctomycetaceae bacterium]|nr:autotransporter domain-containing protein [Planctomycetaceae bacterium]